ncbi:LPD25 domain-containing protein [uncultured Dialister sp.]|jgi:hypothetical protein|uniref:LPD25 domain-containing protein n=1 Tax=uncultured Dialister sp. TaxID=278064 RepID=UPI002614D410|nr:LPD25 domain-containing protein [uncultured Dialister sp.]
MTREERRQEQAALIRHYLENGGALEEYPDAGARVVRIGHFKAVAFHGDNKRPDFYFRFESEYSREKYISSYISRRLKRIQEAKERKAELKANGRQLTGAAKSAHDLKAELKRLFPSFRFSVTSDSFSGGESIHVRWIDGPSYDMVKRIADSFNHSEYCYVLCYHETSQEFLDKAIAFAKNGDPAGLQTAEAYNRKESFAVDYYYHFMEKWASPEILAVKHAQEEEDRKEQEAEKKAEEEKRKAEAERVQAVRRKGKQMIDYYTGEYPIKSGENYVLIHWSECPAFYDWEKDALKLSLPAADAIFKNLDNKSTSPFGYYKTKFSIISPSGETLFTDRYDIGDLNGGLYRFLMTDGGAEFVPDSEKSENPLGGSPAAPSDSSLLCQLAGYMADLRVSSNFHWDRLQQARESPEYKKAYISSVIRNAFKKGDNK